jgi:hypothetical protein
MQPDAWIAYVFDVARQVDQLIRCFEQKGPVNAVNRDVFGDRLLLILLVILQCVFAAMLKVGAAILAIPCATNSTFELWRAPDILSATMADIAIR